MLSGRWKALALLIAVSTMLAPTSGCQRWTGVARLRRERLDAPGRQDAAEVAKASPALNQDIWIRTFPAPGAPDKQPEYRWQNPAMTQMLVLPADEQPDLHAALTSGAPIVEINAAIALSRLHDAAGQQLLVRAVRDMKLKLAFRRAAVEALGHLSGPTVASALKELETRYGRFDADHAAIYVPELHAELLYALSRHVEPADAACFTSASRSPSVDVRLATLECWTRASRGELPAMVTDLRSDPEDRVRVAALRALAARHHPRTLEWSKGAMHDYKLDVHLAAIAAAGSVGGDEAIAAVKHEMQQDSEIIRAATVRALANLHDTASVRAAVEDKSWRVRKVVATMLVEQKPEEVQSLVRTLMEDRSAEVQRQMIESLDTWPVEAAGPLLLEAMAQSTYLARKTAAERLTRRWPPAAEFTADLPAERRDEVLKQLWTAWRSEHHLATPERPAVAASASKPATPAELSQARALLVVLQAETSTEDARREALAGLKKLGPRLLPTIAALRIDEEQRIPDAVYLELLPPLSPLFGTLELLASKEVGDRRRAASELAQRELEEPLEPLAVDRVAGLGVAESDPLVCRWLLAAVRDDNSGLSKPLVYAGMSHRDDEIRRLACEHLARTAKAADRDVLLPALEDPYPPVVRAALRALSRPGVLAEPGRLLVALRSMDKSIQLEAAVALVRLESPEGPPAIERLAHDNDGEVRRLTAVAIGPLHDPQFEGLLVDLLDDPVARRAAVESLAQVVGRDIALPAEGPPLSLVERIDRWKHWWNDQGSTRR